MPGVGQEETLCLVSWQHIRWAVVDSVYMGSCNPDIEEGCENHKHLSKCITISSLEEPLLIASTSPQLSHFNSVSFFINSGPHTAQPITIGTSSFAIMPTVHHSAGQAYWNHWSLHWCHSPKSLRHLSQLDYRRRFVGNNTQGSWRHSNCWQRNATNASRI